MQLLTLLLEIARTESGAAFFVRPERISIVGDLFALVHAAPPRCQLLALSLLGSLLPRLPPPQVDAGLAKCVQLPAGVAPAVSTLLLLAIAKSVALQVRVPGTTKNPAPLALSVCRCVCVGHHN